jgi:hypothetical protein
MDIMTILDLVAKGVGVISTLAQSAQDVAPAVKVVTDLLSGAKAGTVTDQQLMDAETALDKMISDFNAPIV